MTTATLTISDVWITNVATNVSVTAPFRDRATTATTEGAIRSYAGGRLRVITTAKRTRDFPLVLEWFNDADLALLDSWRGQLLLLRDSGGRRSFGTFLTLTVDDLWPSTGILHAVTLTFSEISFSEAV